MPAAFTPGDLVIYRVGDGVGKPVTSGNPVFLDEYTPSGTLVQSVALPTVASGANYPLVATGPITSSSPEGLLTRSADGRYLVLTGYGSIVPAPGSLVLSSTPAADVPRVIGRVDAAGVIDTTTALTDAADGSGPRSATSLDGSAFWVAGGSGGVRYATLGATTSVKVSQGTSANATNFRQVNVFNGQLYVSTGAGTAVRVGTVGTGTPTTSGQAVTNLPGIPTLSGSPNSFFFATPTTLYVADDSSPSPTSPNGIVKYVLVNGSWAIQGWVEAPGIRGLIGVVGSNGAVTLYGTGVPASTFDNTLYSFTDTTNSIGTISGTATTLVSIPSRSNTAFRGVAFVPENFALAAATLPAATQNVAYLQAITTGGAAPYTFTLNSGSPPAGLSFNPATGVLSGTPTGTGTATFSVTVTDTTGLNQTRVFSLTVGSPATVTSVTRDGGIGTNADRVSWTVTFSQPVSGVTAANFAVTDVTGNLSGQGVLSAAPVGGGPNATQWTVTALTGTPNPDPGYGFLELVIDNSDGVVPRIGGLPVAPSGRGYHVDKSPPGVTSITRLDPTPTLAGTVRFRVTFNDVVSGVSLNDFALGPGAPVGARVTGFGDSTSAGTTFILTVSTGTGSGIIRLDVIDDDTIIDKGTNVLGGPGAGNGDFTTGEAYTIDRTGPSVVIGPPSVALTRGGPVTFTITYNDPDPITITLSPADVLLNKSGSVTVATVDVSGTGNTRVVTLGGITGDGTLGISLKAGTAADPLLNPALAAGPSDTVTVDNTPPAVSAPALAAGFDSGESSTDTVTNLTSLTFTGTAEAGARVELFEGTASLESTTATGGNWTISGVSLTAGPHTIFVRATDAAGNSADSDPLAVRVETTPPTVTSFEHTPAGPVVVGTPLTYTVRFDEDIDAATVTADDFENAGTAAISVGIITEIVPGVFEFAITPTTYGTVQLRVLSTNSVADVAGNALAAATTDTAVVVILDPTPPTVRSITRADADPTNAASVRFTVTFSEDVTGVDADDFTLAAPDLSGAKITEVSGSGDTYSVIVTTGTGNGTLRLDLSDDDSIHDVSGNPLGGPGTGNGDFTTGEAYMLDRTAPGVTVARAAGQPAVANTQPLHFIVAVSEPVGEFGPGMVKLTGTAGGLAGATIMVTNPSDDGMTFDVAVSGLTADGTVTLTVEAGKVRDPAGNPNAAGTGTDNTVTLDTTAPAVGSIRRATPLAAVTNAASVTFAVTLTEPVFGLDTNPAGGFDNFAPAGTATGTSITAVTATADPRVFLVTVATGAVDGTLRLDLSGVGSIRDAAGNALAGTSPGDEAYTIDKTAPGVGILPVSPALRRAPVADIDISFTESVRGFGPGSLTLTRDGTPVSLAGTSLTGGDGRYTLTGLSALTGADGEYVLLLSAAGITDNADNELPAGASVSFTVDATGPTVTITPDTIGPTNAGTVTYTVAFTEPVNGVDTDPAGGFDHFSVTTDGTLDGAAITSVIPSIKPGEYRVTVSTGTGQGTITLSLSAGTAITDAAGNPVGELPATSAAIAVDHESPTIAFAGDDADNLVPAGATLTYTVDILDPSGVVASVRPTDFTNRGTAGISIGDVVTAPIPGGVRYTVPVTAGSGGTIVLQLGGSAVVRDGAGNPLSLPAWDDDTVTVDAVAPAAAVARAVGQTSPANAQPIRFTVTFSESVRGFGPASVLLSGTAGGLAAASINVTNPTGDGRTFAVEIGGLTGDGTVAVSVAAGAVTDVAGNPNTASPGTAEIVLDTTPPAVADITRLDPAVTRIDSVRFRVTFTEPVLASAVGADDFTVLASGTTFAGVSVAPVGGGTADSKFDVTVAGVAGDGVLSLSVAGASATVPDSAGNALAADFSGPAFTIDQTPPAVTVRRQAGQATLTSSQPVLFAVTFSEPVMGFGPAAVLLAGTAGGLAAANVTVTNPSDDGQAFEVAVGGLTGDGTVRLSVPSRAVTDVAGNPNAASPGAAEVVLDTTPPSVSAPTLSPASDTGVSGDNRTSATTPTLAGTAEDGALVELFADGIPVGSTTAAGGPWAITTTTLADGTHTVFARATDAAGNSTDSPPLALTIDTRPPAAIVTRAAAQPALTATTAAPTAVVFTVRFDEPVTGFDAADVTVSGTAGPTTTQVAGSGAEYTVTVGGIRKPGTVAIAIRANAATDAAGNPNTASGPGEPVAVEFVTATALIVSPAAPTAGGAVTMTAIVSSAAATPPAGTVVFTLTGPGGASRQTVVLLNGSATALFGPLPAGHYTVTADYTAGTGFRDSSASGELDVTEEVSVPPSPIPPDTTVAPPVGQNTTGQFVVSAGTTATLYTPGTTTTRAFTPFTAAEAPGGVRAVLADVNHDGTPDLLATTGPGGPVLLRVIDGKTGAVLLDRPVLDSFTGGALVAAGDVDGDGGADIVLTPDQGGGPRVIVLSGLDGSVLADFWGIDDPNFRGGARAAVGDVDGDGLADLVVSAGYGGGPRVAGYDGRSLRPGVAPRHLFSDFFVFESTLRDGAYLTVGDLDGDGFGDVIAGGGPGGAPRVFAVSGRELLAGRVAPLASFFAGDLNARGGALLAAKDVDGDGKADLVAADGDGAAVQVYLGADLTMGELRPAYTLAGTLGGIYVG